MIIRSPLASAFRYNGLKTGCPTYFLRLPRPVQSLTVTRNLSRTSNIKSSIVGGGATTPHLRDGYFSTNSLLEKARHTSRRNNISATVNGNGTIAAQTQATEIPSKLVEKSTYVPQQTTEDLLPHRRRKAAKDAAAAAAETSQQQTDFIPENSSTTLSNTASALPRNSLRRLFPVLLSLSKPRLSVLVVLTAMASYSLYPVPELLSPSSLSTPSLSPLTLLFLTTGTALSAASANAFNMLYEPKWDALMSRTKNRPLVRGLISPRGAALFAILSGVAGVGALYYGVNPTVSFLGALNIALYAGVYTPLKRVSVLNTWIGAIVGGIPPLMGWAAAAGQTAASGAEAEWKQLLLGQENIGAWLLAGLLVAWQFPHFMSLSWSIRQEYKNAGYRMLAWVNPARNARVALRYSLLFFPICVGLSYAGITEWSFVVASAPVNVWLAKEAWRFWKYEGLKGSARGLFWASVWHLPVLLVLAMVEKKGLWGRVWRGLGFGVLDDEDEFDEAEWEDEEDEAMKSTSATPVKIAVR